MSLSTSTPLNRYAVLLSVFISITCGQQGPTPPPPTDTAIRYALILKTLGEVTQSRVALQAKAQQYRETVDVLTAQDKSRRESCVCFNNSAIAFTAHLDKDIATLGIDQPMPFDNVTLNVGNGYDARHAQFRAPVNGTYQFFVSVSTNAGYKLAVDIMLNGTPLVKLRTGNVNQFNRATNGVTVHMAAGDDLWVQHDHAIADSNRLFVGEGMLNTFSGYLVNKD